MYVYESENVDVFVDWESYRHCAADDSGAKLSFPTLHPSTNSHRYCYYFIHIMPRWHTHIKSHTIVVTT